MDYRKKDQKTEMPHLRIPWASLRHRCKPAAPTSNSRNSSRRKKQNIEREQRDGRKRHTQSPSGHPPIHQRSNTQPERHFTDRHHWQQYIQRTRPHAVFGYDALKILHVQKLINTAR